MISVSAGHQFAVNRWNPGYTGGSKSGQGVQGARPMSQGATQGGSEQATGHQGPAAGSGGIFVLFVLVS